MLARVTVSSLCAGRSKVALSTVVVVVLVACGGGNAPVAGEVEALRTEVSQLREELAQAAVTSVPPQSTAPTPTSPSTTSSTSATTSTTATTTTTSTTSTTSTATTTSTTSTTTTTTLPPAVSVRDDVETFCLLDLALVKQNGRSICAGPQGSYQVEVRDGAGSILVVAPLENSTVIDDVDSDGFQELTCGFTYSAELPTTNIYTFTLAHQTDQLFSVTLNATDLARGAPRFFLTFSCVVGSSSCQTRAQGAPPR